MPHLILETSNNIAHLIDYKNLFSSLHRMLEQRLPTCIHNCKSRVIIHSQFYIGDGHEHTGFAHLTIKIMAGREQAILSKLGQDLLTTLKNFIPATDMNHHNIQFSLEVVELSEHYFKS